MNNNILKIRIILFSCLGILLSHSCGNPLSENQNSQTDSVRNNTEILVKDSLLIREKSENDTLTQKTDSAYIESPENAFNSFYNKLCEEFDKGNIAALNKYIHPEMGLYFIDRPGAIDVIDTAKNMEAFYRKVYMGKTRLKGLACKLQQKPIPKNYCDKQYKGCYIEDTQNFKELSRLKKALLQYDFKDNYLPKDDAKLPGFEKHIKSNVVNFDKAISISFLYIDDKWFIGVIDLAKYSCSA